MELHVHPLDLRRGVRREVDLNVSEVFIKRAERAVGLLGSVQGPPRLGTFLRPFPSWCRFAAGTSQGSRSRTAGLDIAKDTAAARVFREPLGRRLSSLRRVEAMEELGRGGRLRGGAAGELVAAAYAAESAHGPRLARGLSLADLAHAVALVEGGDLAGEDARALLRGLLELRRDPGRGVPVGSRRSATPSTRARPSSSAASAAPPPAG